MHDILKQICSDMSYIVDRTRWLEMWKRMHPECTTEYREWKTKMTREFTIKTLKLKDTYTKNRDELFKIADPYQKKWLDILESLISDDAERILLGVDNED